MKRNHYIVNFNLNIILLEILNLILDRLMIMPLLLK